TKVTEGEDIQLECAAEGVPTPVITWTFRGKIIPASSVNGYSSLVVRNARKKDEGTYSCVAEKTLLADAECVSGDPPPRIRWLKSGEFVKSSNRIQLLKNGSLVINGATAEDKGLYECRAFNEIGTVVAGTAELTLQDSPQIVVKPEDVVVDQGGTILVNCGAMGEPAPSIQWQREGITIITEDSHGSLAVPHVGRVFRHADEDVIILLLQTMGISVLDHIQSLKPAILGNVKLMEAGQTGQYGRSALQLVVRVSINAPGPAITQYLKTEESHAQEKPHKSKTATLNHALWSPWQPCDVTCGKGVQTRLRKCDKPAPSHGGLLCEGSVRQTQMCELDACPVDGKWTLWSPWSACSSSCNNGIRTRTRTCTTAEHGGRSCPGEDTQSMVVGVLGQPGEAVVVAVTGDSRRGTGRATIHSHNTGASLVLVQPQRQKVAVLSLVQSMGSGAHGQNGVNVQQHVVGEKGQEPVLVTNHNLSRPTQAYGSIIGTVNNLEFGVSTLHANITKSRSGNHRVIAVMTDIPANVGFWLRKLVSILTPVYWTTALEVGEAVNGYTLTKGIFQRETQVEFPTGETLHMTHNARGLDDNGVLQLDIVLKGDVPHLSSTANIILKDYVEDYVQTGPGQIYAFSTRMFTVDGHMQLSAVSKQRWWGKF
ncbi:Hemicentin-1, partial [Branchiostoma belcheri]